MSTWPPKRPKAEQEDLRLVMRNQIIPESHVVAYWKACSAGVFCNVVGIQRFGGKTWFSGTSIRELSFIHGRNRCLTWGDIALVKWQEPNESFVFIETLEFAEIQPGQYSNGDRLFDYHISEKADNHEEVFQFIWPLYSAGWRCRPVYSAEIDFCAKLSFRQIDAWEKIHQTTPGLRWMSVLSLSKIQMREEARCRSIVENAKRPSISTTRFFQMTNAASRLTKQTTNT